MDIWWWTIAIAMISVFIWSCKLYQELSHVFSGKGNTCHKNTQFKQFF